MKKKYYLIITILCIVVASPIIIQGIICNDELLTRLYASKGVYSIVKYYLRIAIPQGRILAVPLLSLGGIIGFGSKYLIINGLIKICFIILHVSLFAFLIYRILKDKKFSIFLSICLMVFLPISFEHTMPSAFVSMFGVPFVFLIISFIAFDIYLEKNSKGYMIGSIILLFIALTGYELFITYTPLYLILVLSNSHKQDISFKYIFNKLKYHIIVSIVYLTLYFILGQIFKTNYAGNKIGSFQSDTVLAIIFHIFKSSLPGFYIFNSKYKYLVNLYNGFETYKLYEIFNVRIIIFFVSLVALLKSLFYRDYRSVNKENKVNLIKVIRGVICGIIFIVLPIIPNSLTEAWQGLENLNQCLGTTTSYFVYFSTMFTICYLIWNILNVFKDKYYILLSSSVIIFIVILGTGIQISNNIFSKEQNSNYNRLIEIEELFKTDFVKKLNYFQIYSSDIFETRNSLAINDNYWNEFIKNQNLNIDISNNDKAQKIKISYIDDKYFLIQYEDNIIIFSKKSLNEKQILIENNNIYTKVTLKDYLKDSGFYVYYLKYKGNKLEQILSEQALDKMFQPIGNTLEQAEGILGFYDGDKWVEKISQFRISTGNEGKIHIKGYYPEKIERTLSMNIYVNNQLEKFILRDNVFELDINAPKNDVVDIKIECNFEKRASNIDARMVSFVLNELNGK